MKPAYCTQNDGDCATCSLVNYGRDCMNIKVMERRTYRIEYEHEGHWLVGESSGIDDLGGTFTSREEAETTIRACADTERMEGREMPRTRIVEGGAQ